MRLFKIIPAVCFLLALAVVATAHAAPAQQAASRILAATGIQGGLVVHVGCGDGKLTAALRSGDSYIVHGLDRDPENVTAARQHIQSLGQYGNVFVEPWSGDRLPHVDNSVNLIVVSCEPAVDRSELLRVLCPGGVAVTLDAQQSTVDTVYGYGRLWQYYRWTTPLEYHLFAANKQPTLVEAGSERKPIKRGGKRVGVRTRAVTRFVPDWSDNVSVQVNSMVLTDGALFAAGPPDVEDEEQSVKSLLDPETQKKLAEQSVAFEGRRGALLVAVSPEDGRKLAAYRLDVVPRFDGMIAANGRLYVSTLGGEVLCLHSTAGQPLPPAKDVVVAARE